MVSYAKYVTVGKFCVVPELHALCLFLRTQIFLQNSVPCCRRHEKAVGKLREETRVLRLLTQQAVEERAELAARSLVSILAPVPGCPTVHTAFTSPLTRD